MPGSKLHQRHVWFKEPYASVTFLSVSARSLKVKPSLVQNFLVRIGVIDTHAQHHDTFLNVLGLVALKVVRLNGAAPSEILRIKYRTTHLPR